jgi:hypothetical protein
LEWVFKTTWRIYRTLLVLLNMSEFAQEPPQSSDVVDADALLQALRRKEGTWVEWGQACQKLQKSGYSPQTIFEATGFEPVQQNQVIVGAQVYGTLLSVGVSPEVQAHFAQRGSELLYELRVLTQTERAALAGLLFAKKLDVDAARDIVKAVKDYSRLPALPEGFSDQVGDAVAYHYWRLARQQTDLQARSRLIAQAFTFVESEAARRQIEKLLTDFSVVPAQQAPFWPIYRLESEESLPRIIPVVGQYPLTTADLQAVPLVEEVEPFRVVQFSGNGAWVPIPGWQVILNAEDPVAMLCNSQALPTPLPGNPEKVLLVIDRAQRQWDADSYFVCEGAEHLELRWFEQVPEHPLLGRVILVLRPKKILDERVTRDVWQIDE